MRKVVVTGIGAVTPLGNTFSESWPSLMSCRSGISKITRFDVSGIPFMVAGQINDLRHDLTFKETRRYDLFIQYALVAADEVLKEAGLIGQEAGRVLSRAGVFIGTSRAGISSLDQGIRREGKHRRRTVSPYLMPSTTGSMAASAVAQKYGIQGECIGFSNACASGLVAIGNAIRSIRHGYSDIVIAGGTDAPLCPVCVEGYGAMGALSKRGTPDASRPFDRDRDGFVLAEGACLLLLESRESAEERGAVILGEIAGYGSSTDAFHQTRPNAEGEAHAMRKAMDDAGIDPVSVAFVSAHATSTRLGDMTEANALQRVFGETATKIPAMAVKSSTGHMLAGSSAFETAVSLMALREGVIPPTLNVHHMDAECGIHVETRPQSTDGVFAMVNSFGFGGVNAVVVIKKTGERYRR